MRTRAEGSTKFRSVQSEHRELGGEILEAEQHRCDSTRRVSFEQREKRINPSLSASLQRSNFLGVNF